VVWAAGFALVAAVGLVLPYLADCASQSGEVLRTIDPQAALRCHRSAVALAPEHALYWTKLAAVAKECADRETLSEARLQWLRVARDAVDRATQLVPTDPANHANRGRVLAALTAPGEGDGDAALAEFDSAIAAAPYNLVFRADAGQAALDAGRLSRARSYFEAGRIVDPRCARFVMGLGAVALREGRARDALAYLEECRTLEWYDGTGCGRLPALLAVAYLATHHAEDAELWAREALIYHPEDAVPHWVLAGAMELEGHAAEAAREYRTVLRLAPAMQPARDALRRLGAVSQ
jgi:tetratricopeptide (TPR) repeat protein